MFFEALPLCLWRFDVWCWGNVYVPVSMARVVEYRNCWCSKHLTPISITYIQVDIFNTSLVKTMLFIYMLKNHIQFFQLD